MLNIEFSINKIKTHNHAQMRICILVFLSLNLPHGGLNRDQSVV